MSSLCLVPRHSDLLVSCQHIRSVGLFVHKRHEEIVVNELLLFELGIQGTRP